MIKEVTKLTSLLLGLLCLHNGLFANDKALKVGYCSPTISNNQVYLNRVFFAHRTSDVSGGADHINTNNTGYTTTLGSSSGTILKRQCSTGIWITVMTTLNTLVDYKVTAYGDWNNDGDFEDLNEKCGEFINFIPANSGNYKSGDFSFTVPQNAVSGNVRMRFIASMANATVTPCGSVNGEVEDYIVTIANNTAPVLDLSASPVLNSINTSQTDNDGISVKSLIKSAGNTTKLITDADPCSDRQGIVITGTTGNGIWQYKTSNGVWTSVGSVSTTSALLLNDSSSVRYVPSVNTETATITIKAWDMSSGSNATLANVSSNGGVTAYSLNSKTINQEVKPSAGYTDNMLIVSSSAPNKIVSAPFDRNNKSINLSKVLSTNINYGYTYDLELDENTGKMYWGGTGSLGSDIYVSKTDLSNPTSVFNNGDYPGGVALGGGKMFVIQYNGLFSANLDGSSITSISGDVGQFDKTLIGEPKDIDFHNNKLYFVFYSYGDNKYHLYESDTDGKNSVELYSTLNALYSLDVTNNTLYWVETESGNGVLHKRSIVGSGSGTTLGTINGVPLYQVKVDNNKSTVYVATYEDNGTSKVYTIPTSGGVFNKIADLDFVVGGLSFPTSVVLNPTISKSGSLSAFTTCSGKASVSQTFTVAGSDLTNDIAINAPTGFEISTVEASGYASSVTLTQVAGIVSSTTIYARLASNATGNPSGDISISSTGAAPTSLGINGTVIVTPMAPETQGDSVCDNGTLTLMAKLAENRTSGQLYSIKWYDASTNGTLVHTGSTFVTGTLNSSTYYYASVEVSGCESPRTPTLALVTATPEKPYISTAGPQCKEGSFTFNALMPVKINCRNCGDDNIYLWKNSKGDSVFNDADFTTPILKSTETYTVTAEMNGCISQPTIVNAVILNIPTPKVLSINPVCSGNTTTISVETISAGRISGCRNCGELYDYTWYNVNGDSIGTGSSFNTQSMLFNTKFYVKASDNGCYSDSSEINVYVIDKPEISQELIDLTICNGSIAKFKVVSDGENLNYNWGMTDGTNWMIEPSETKDSVEFEVDGGLDGVKIFTIVSNTCGKDTSLANLSVMVVDTAVSVQNGIISANITDEEYQWVNMDTKSIIDGETNRAYSPTKTGTYAVVITQYFGKGRYCTDTSGARYVEVVATGLENSIVSNFSIYPNPATDNVTVSFTESVSGTVSIVDMNGNVVATKSISGNTSNISTAEFASGVYVVKINSDKGMAVKQLVIQ
ncbi:MAG: hypothetical protein RLZZ175_2075 [Bacteroidota bacterium]|jgi:hypothetical protein